MKNSYNVIFCTVLHLGITSVIIDSDRYTIDYHFKHTSTTGGGGRETDTIGTTPTPFATNTGLSSPSTETTTHSIHRGHRYPCNNDEYKSAACLNGGVCYVISMTHRTSHCNCPTPYTGIRCQEIDILQLLHGHSDHGFAYG